MIRAQIAGIGTCVPERVVTNSDLAKLVDTSEEWIRTRTGIEQRRILEPDSAIQASDLGAEAARRALANANLNPGDIDCIICGTFTPDYVFPSTACLIQKKIGAQKASAFDVAAACSGFVYALNVADALIRAGRQRHVLIVGTEIVSKVLDWKDRNTCVLFGDGAGAMVLSAGNGENGVLSSHIGSDGSLGNILTLPAWGTPRFLKMNGPEVFKNAVRMMEDSVNRVIKDAGLALDDVGLLVAHQANVRIISATASQVGIPMSKVYVNLNKYGNTSSASIPLALKDALDDKRIQKDTVVVLVAVGGGLTWGAAAIRW